MLKAFNFHKWQMFFKVVYPPVISTIGEPVSNLAEGTKDYPKYP